MLSNHFRMMGRFNAWANRRVYDAVSRLGEDDYRTQRPAAFFGSIHGTLNHLLVVDRLWFGRIEGVDPGASRLDQILYDDLADLRPAREAEDGRIVGMVDGLGDGDLDREASFTTTDGKTAVLPVRVMLATVFNHQTHHRGQVHAMLKETAVAPPPLDVIYFLHEDW